ncbi:MAG: type II toxin-antitoxin system HicB family antitoxin [Chloroflexi bacterium]|nr:type II toxin-antitoxin system HicB family antitoxin [Chloroflexota bacterium]MYE42327.1 type II toxin-antitoxin system HicB family antitoxin [Chloroflexota bacterium]
MRDFYVVVEQDEDGYYVGEVPQLKGCYSQGLTLEELMRNMREVICLVLEERENRPDVADRFVGVHRITV